MSKTKIRVIPLLFLIAILSVFPSLLVKADTTVCPNHRMEWVVTRKATCTTEGEKKHMCKTCGKVDKTAAVKKTKHKYKWETTQNATCNAKGKKSYKCTICGHVSKTKDIKKKSHKYKWVTTKKAACGESGEKVYKCKNCNHVKKKKTTKKAGHKYITKISTTKRDSVKYKGKKYPLYTAEAVTGCSRCGKTISVTHYNYVTNGGNKIRKGCAAKCYYADDTLRSYSKVKTATFSNKKAIKAGTKKSDWEISGLKWKKANKDHGIVTYYIKRSAKKEPRSVTWNTGEAITGNDNPSNTKQDKKPSGSGYSFGEDSRDDPSDITDDASSSDNSPASTSKLVVDNGAGEIIDVANGGASSIQSASTSAKKGPQANSTTPAPTKANTVTTAKTSSGKTDTTKTSTTTTTKTETKTSTSKPANTSVVEDIAAVKGAIKTIGNAKVKVTGTKSVSYAAPASPSITKVNVPTTVSINGKSYNVTKIESKAFKNNKRLKSITIPASVKSIGKEAFKGCSNLKRINIKSKYLTSKRVGKNAFKGINKKATIKVVKSKKKAYKSLLKKKGAPTSVKVK